MTAHEFYMHGDADNVWVAGQSYRDDDERTTEVAFYMGCIAMVRVVLHDDDKEADRVLLHIDRNLFGAGTWSKGELLDTSHKHIEKFYDWAEQVIDSEKETDQ